MCIDLLFHSTESFWCERTCSVYLWFKPTSLYEDKQLCSLSQTVSSTKTQTSFFKLHVSALILMLLISISIQTEMIRTMFFQTRCVLLFLHMSERNTQLFHYSLHLISQSFNILLNAGLWLVKEYLMVVLLLLLK